MHVLGLLLMVMLASTSTHAGQNSAVVGSWDFTAFSQDGPFKSVLVVREEDGKLKAVAQMPEGETLPYESIVVDGTRITMVITVTYDGSRVEIIFTGTISEGKMEGKADYGGRSDGTWVAIAKK